MPKSHSTPHYVYILRCSDNSYYTGITENLPARLALHNQGKGSRHTRVRRPVTLAYQEGPLPLRSAMARERELKGWNRSRKEALISASPQSPRYLAL